MSALSDRYRNASGGRGKSRKSLELIDTARRFLEQQNPTTVRGVCYYLFVHGAIPSMAKKETQKVSRLLKDAREEGWIPWAWIVDEHRELERSPSWSEPEDFVRTVRQAYRRDFWEHQERLVEVWSEKGTVRGILAGVLKRYGVGFRVFNGFNSATAVRDIATLERPLTALYVGDWDPSGMYMSEKDLPQRLEQYGDRDIDLQRVALLSGHLRGLPSFPIKRKDPRAPWFHERYGSDCWELDAMSANDLRETVEAAIRDQIEWDAWQRCEEAEKAETESLQSVLDNWTGRLAS